MSAGQKPEWTVLYMQIVDTEERRQVYRRNTSKHARPRHVGRSVGYVVCITNEEGKTLGWECHVYQSSSRRNPSARKVGGRHKGVRAHDAAAAVVWNNRILQGLEDTQAVTPPKAQGRRTRVLARPRPPALIMGDSL